MSAESVAHAATRKSEVMFDAEHFLDGYKANPAYAMECIEAAYRAGAGWVVLCDTNSGTLPGEVARLVATVCERIPGTDRKSVVLGVSVSERVDTCGRRIIKTKNMLKDKHERSRDII